ncbi:MAG: Signal transduction histidine kinaselike protein, partial [Actinomycetia bacterium]|nr:Signal transduction histidine kinaselike protein [Actinomycetes bacterium]
MAARPVRLQLHLHRRDEGRIVAGVAAGLATTLRVEPNAVRLAFVVLTVAGGIGALVYGAAWLFLPLDDDPLDATAAPASDGVQLAALGAVVFGLLLLLRRVPWWPGDAVVWPLV